MDLNGQPLIRHVWDHARKIRGIDELLVATVGTDVVPLAFGIGREQSLIAAFTALDDNDVLGRYAVAAATYRARIVMRLTGDCPLLDSDLCSEVLKCYKQQAAYGCDYASNIAPGYVDGEDCEVFSATALMNANIEATDPHDREHVTPWIRRHYQIATLTPKEDRSHLKTSVDTLEDYQRVKAMMEGGATA